MNKISQKQGELFMSNKIIGMCGLKGQGKNTVGSIIKNHFNNWELVSFATTLKDAIASMFGWNRDWLEGVTEESRAWREQPDEYWSKKFGREVSPRTIMQEFGTNLVREKWLASFWIDSLEKNIMNSDKNIIITDVRYPNEMEMVKRLNGKLWLTHIGYLPYYWNAVCEYNKTGKIPEDELVTLEEIENIHRSERDWIQPIENFDAFINPAVKGLDELEKIVIDAYENTKWLE